MKLSDVISTELKKKSTEEIDQLVKGTGEKNNLTFSEAGLDEEIIKLQTISYDGDTAYYVKKKVIEVIGSVIN